MIKIITDILAVLAIAVGLIFAIKLYCKMKEKTVFAFIFIAGVAGILRGFLLFSRFCGFAAVEWVASLMVIMWIFYAYTMIRMWRLVMNIKHKGDE